MAEREKTSAEASASKKAHHVVLCPSGGWSVKRGGAVRASKHLKTKWQAVRQGRAISRKHNTDLYVHNEDGTVEQKESLRKDPNPS
ncbi:DUF2188 domain-containing protein [Gemmatimonadota bacterium]